MNSSFESNASQAPSQKTVIGEGWAALAAVGISLDSGHAVTWLPGTGTRLANALPSIESGELNTGGSGAELWSRLAHRYGVETGPLSTGSFLREFRNKAFREPLWTKAPTPETRAEVMRESLWISEAGLSPQFEARFERTFNEIEADLRTKILAHPRLTRLEAVPISGFHGEKHRIESILLASGAKVDVGPHDEVIYADRWTALPGMAGMPKGISFLRKREPVSVLEATFTHAVPIGAGVIEGFFGPLHREAGEEFERHLWGHFASDGMRSIWILCLAGEEVEDNHQIAKKLRRMKNALEKMFSGSPWLAQPAEGEAGARGFSANVVSETVRFVEGAVYADREPLPGIAGTEGVPVHVGALHGLGFATDGYGPSTAILQVARILNWQADPQAESMKSIPAETPASQELGG